MEIHPKEGPEFFEATMPVEEFRSRLGFPEEYTIVRVMERWGTGDIVFTMTKTKKED